MIWGDRTTLSGDALKKILRDSLIFALEGFDEYYSVIRLGLLCVEALDAKRHGAYSLFCVTTTSTDLMY